MALTKVKAINICLASIGRSPVASEDDPDLDAAMASAEIDQASLDIQSIGWWFNKEGNWKLAPDSNGEIIVPNNAIEIVSWNTSRECDLSIRGRRVYDKVNHTFDLSSLVNGSGTIEFLFILELPFADLPPLAQYAIIYRARRIFHSNVDGDSQKLREHAADEELSFNRLDMTDKRSQKHNLINDNAVNASVIGTVGGRNGRIFGHLRTFPRSASDG